METFSNKMYFLTNLNYNCYQKEENLMARRYNTSTTKPEKPNDKKFSDIDKEVRNRIKNQREKKNIKSESLYRIMGTKSTASKFEKGKREKIFLHELPFLADELDTFVESFFNDNVIFDENIIYAMSKGAYREHIQDPSISGNPFTDDIPIEKPENEQLHTDDYENGRIDTLYKFTEHKIEKTINKIGYIKAFCCLHKFSFDITNNNLDDIVSIDRIISDDDYTNYYFNRIITNLKEDSEFMKKIQKKENDMSDKDK